MSVYTYLFNLIDAAAKQAKRLHDLDDDQLSWMYDQIHTTIYRAQVGGMISKYQRKLLFSRLDAVWGAPEGMIDNGY